MKLLTYYQCAKTLFITEFLSLKSIVFNRTLSIYIWSTCNMLVGAYFFPQLGMTNAFGLLSLASCLSVAGLMDGFGNIMDLVIDMTTDRVIYYYATLPIPNWLIFAVKMSVLFVFYFFYTLAILPLGKILIWHELNLLAVNWPLLLIAMILGNAFYASLTVFIASFTKKRTDVSNIWRSCIFPLWFLGGFGFTWNVIYKVSPQFAYIELLNPVIHISEMYRTAILADRLGPLLNFWFCCTMIIIFTISAGWIGIKRLKRQCDFI